MSGTIHKELRPAAKKARERGWTVEPAKNSHLHWRDDDGQLRVVSSGTPSGGAIRRTLADLKKAGLDV